MGNRTERVSRMASQVRAGRLDRREFMAMACILGVAAPTAAAMLGALAPAPAAAQEPRRGGVLRIGQQILDINDPRTYDWPQKANVARQFCEPLVRWEPDGSFSPSLLEAWEVSDEGSLQESDLCVRWTRTGHERGHAARSSEALARSGRSFPGAGCSSMSQE